MANQYKCETCGKNFESTESLSAHNMQEHAKSSGSSRSGEGENKSKQDISKNMSNKAAGEMSAKGEAGREDKSTGEN